MVLVIKKVDERKLREFKAEAVRRGLTLSQAFEEAVELWLRSRGNIITEEDVNNSVFLELKKDLDRYRGKYIVIAHGKFLGAYDSLREVASILLKIKPEVKHAIVFKVGFDRKIKGELEWLGGSMKLEPA